MLVSESINHTITKNELNKFTGLNNFSSTKDTG